MLVACLAVLLLHIVVKNLRKITGNRVESVAWPCSPPRSLTVPGVGDSPLEICPMRFHERSPPRQSRQACCAGLESGLRRIDERSGQALRMFLPSDRRRPVPRGGPRCTSLESGLRQIDVRMEQALQVSLPSYRRRPVPRAGLGDAWAREHGNAAYRRTARRVVCIASLRDVKLSGAAAS